MPAGRWCCMVVGNFEIFSKNLPVSSMVRVDQEVVETMP